MKAERLSRGKKAKRLKSVLKGKRERRRIQKRKTTLNQSTSPVRRNIHTEAYLSVTEPLVRKTLRLKSLQLELKYLRMKKSS